MHRGHFGTSFLDEFNKGIFPPNFEDNIYHCLGKFVDKNGKEYHLEEDGILYPYDESNQTKYRYVFPDDRYFIV